MIARLKVEEMDEFLFLFKKEIESLLAETGVRSLNDYKEMFKDNSAQMWLYLGPKHEISIMFTRLIRYPQRLHLSLDLLVGENFDTIKEQWKIMEDWGRSQGAQAAEAWARPGVRKELHSLGFEKKAELIVKEFK